MLSSIDIIVPVFNEELGIDDFYRRVANAGFASSLVFIDNASTDGTVRRIQQYADVRIIRHATNLGYGASIRDGIAATCADFVVVIDADLEYPPEAIAQLVGALQHHAVVYASRFLGGTPAGMPRVRRIGNRIITGIFNLLFGQRTTDLYTGMKGLRRETLQDLDLKQNGFEHVLELSAQLANRGHRIHEIPVTYTPRVVGVSKMRHIPETAKYCWFVLRYRCQFLGSRRFLRRFAPWAS
jgi:glycosyltransferase involved in cell wall biosynthesis